MTCSSLKSFLFILIALWFPCAFAWSKCNSGDIKQSGRTILLNDFRFREVWNWSEFRTIRIRISRISPYFVCHWFRFAKIVFLAFLQIRIAFLVDIVLWYILERPFPAVNLKRTFKITIVSRIVCRTVSIQFHTVPVTISSSCRGLWSDQTNEEKFTSVSSWWTWLYMPSFSIWTTVVFTVWVLSPRPVWAFCVCFLFCSWYETCFSSQLDVVSLVDVNPWITTIHQSLIFDVL